MRRFITCMMIMISTSIFAQSHFQKDPYLITFNQNIPTKPDARVQQTLRDTDAWQNFIAAQGFWSVEFDALNGMPTRAFGKPIPGVGSSPEDITMHFFQNELAEFNAPIDQLEFLKTNTSSKYHYVNYIQKYEGLEVLWSKATSRISLDNKIILFGLSIYPGIELNTTPGINEESAAMFATSGIGIEITNTEVNPLLKILPIRGTGESAGYTYKLVYEVQVKTMDAEQIPGDYYTLVDAQNGAVYYRQNKVHACGAPIMEGNINVTDDVSSNPLLPTTSFKLPHLRIDIDGDTYYTDETGNLFLPDLLADASANVFLRGRYAKVYQDNGSELPDFTVTVSPGDNVLEFPASTNLSAISAYYYQNIVHDYMKLHWPDFTDLDIDQRINTDVTGSCNAFYDGSSTNFYDAGGGCPNTALFDDVVMHEYGHGVNYDLYADLGDPGGMGNGAMQEGYADLWAICNTQNPILGQGFSGGSDTYVRRYDVEPKVYPDDLVGEVHADGEIIAGAWWDLAENLGDDVAAMAELWHLTHFATIDGSAGDEGSIYREVLLETLISDDDNADLSDGTPNDLAIIEAFAEHGITLLANAIIDHSEIETSLLSLEEITIDATLEVDFPAYLGNFTMYWKINTDVIWNEVSMVNTSGDNYDGIIPGQPNGTIIEYYFDVTDIYGGLAVTEPKESGLAIEPNLPYFLLIGYSLKQTEDFDNEFGDWVSDPFGDDEATTGQWDVGEPVETIDGTYINQTGDDHTDGFGNLCAFTGNAGPSDGLGTNDVDGGMTSIRSPFFDATGIDDPLFTYYRWYANDSPTSANPGNDVWQVYISNNGSDYVRVERIGTSDNSWRRNTIRISEYVEPTNSVSLLFAAQDSIIPGYYLDGGSLVEAAVDDLQLWQLGEEIIDTSQDTTGNSIEALNNLIGGIYPNPTKEFVNIYFNQNIANAVIQVSNQLGELVFTDKLNLFGLKFYSLNCSSFPSGIYSITIKNEQSYSTRKIVVQH